MNNNYLASKPRYEILDGLRGVAAVLVVIYHLFEQHWGTSQQPLSHGHLAVDFFFVLSGFVIGYAYDDRWAKGLTTWEFFKRRIVRLHPMVIAGALVGLVTGLLWMNFEPGSWDSVEKGFLPVMFICACCMIPLTKGGEMFMINGPQWSLFLEYVGNILYATVIRFMPKKMFYAFVSLAGAWLVYFLVFSNMTASAATGGDNNAMREWLTSGGTLVGGWSIAPPEIWKGLTRLIFPFFGGMMLYRMNKFINVKGGFLWASLLLVGLFAVPTLGNLTDPLPGDFMPYNTKPWMNGIYEAFVVIVMFPIIVSMGAGSPLEGKVTSKVCIFLGQISYPIYIVHYGFIHMYGNYISTAEGKMSLAQSWPMALAVLVGSIALAWALLKLYDEPVREWLKNKWLRK